MIDNIIFKKVDTKLLFNEIINLNDARLLFLFYYFNPKYRTSLIVDKMIELSNSRYLHFMIRIIGQKYYDKLLNKILTYDDAKLIYYVAYDTKKLNIEQFKLLFNKLLILNNKLYLFLFFNYFYFVRKLYDKEIIDKFKDILKLENVDFDNINENNINKYITKIKKTKENEYNYYTSNCYKGRDMIPDLIVCHISNNYESTIDTFYNPDSEVSAHFVIARDGRIKQVVSLDDCAWAYGTSMSDTSDVYYNFAKIKEIRERKTNANYYSFSIEHESFDGNLTEIQYQSTLKIICKIIDYVKDKYNYDFTIDREHILGHNDVNPIVRTSCPGENFPFDKLIKDLKNIYQK